MVTIVSRGMDRREFLPPPTRINMMESLRLGPLGDRPGPFEPLGRWSEPSTRTLLGLVSGKPAPPRATLPLSAPCWIWALTRKRTSETASHATTPRATHLTTRPGVIRPPRRRRPG